MLELVSRLREIFNVQGIVFYTWYVNGRTRLPDLVSELKSNARVRVTNSGEWTSSSQGFTTSRTGTSP
ncbi:hypothetical protein L3N51_02222 [Metallosphaera sp. J1]|nr:hypothetical protein [Metallosphaera javensis (ex Hofmann et al. 2022)]